MYAYVNLFGKDKKESMVREQCRVIVLMGVTGCGKSTVGELLAERLGWIYCDADDYHPAANVEKMAQGIALNDEDRWPWLRGLGDQIGAWLAAGTGAILACSALKESYRQILVDDRAAVRVVHLKGSRELIAERLAARVHRYMPASLLESQFQTLEEPSDALSVDIDATPDAIVEKIRRDLAL